MIEWVKGGRIFIPQGNNYWSRSHAQVPVIDILNDNIWRIFYATRDNKNISRIGYIDVEAGNPKKILSVGVQPILDIGLPGTFDDCGVMPSWIVKFNKRKYMFYIGWSVKKTVPYHNSIGLAVSNDGGISYKKYSEGPIFSPTPSEPYFTGTSCVIIESGIWKNWYLSCNGWIKVHNKFEPIYDIKYAESRNGLDWKRDNKVAIKLKKGEGGIAKASVIKENNIYKMWYSYRQSKDYRNNINNGYRIGYAESLNGIKWKRKDSMSGINISNLGWDNQMICYPHVITYKKKKYMFYNGNDFGATGIGFATS